MWGNGKENKPTKRANINIVIEMKKIVSMKQNFKISTEIFLKEHLKIKNMMAEMKKTQ